MNGTPRFCCSFLTRTPSRLLASTPAGTSPAAHVAGVGGSSAMSHAPRPRPTVVVVPVKPPAVGKSRLGDLPDDQRHDLAEAFALDTVEAALRTDGVARRPRCHRRLPARGAAAHGGCEVMPDGASDDLNATLVQAAAEVVRTVAGRCPGRPVCRPAGAGGRPSCVPSCDCVPDDRRRVRARPGRHGDDALRRASGGLRAQVRRRVGSRSRGSGRPARSTYRPPASAPTSTTSPTSTRPSSPAWVRTPLRHRARRTTGVRTARGRATPRVTRPR